ATSRDSNSPRTVASAGIMKDTDGPPRLAAIPRSGLLLWRVRRRSERQRFPDRHKQMGDDAGADEILPFFDERLGEGGDVLEVSDRAVASHGEIDAQRRLGSVGGSGVGAG